MQGVLTSSPLRGAVEYMEKGAGRGVLSSQLCRGDGGETTADEGRCKGC